MTHSELTLPELLRSCVVRISAAGETGSGVLVAPGKILTCAHVVQPAMANGADRVEVVHQDRKFGGRIIDLTRSSSDPIYAYPDLAIVQADELSEHPCAWICDTKLGEKAPLTAYGHDRIYGGEQYRPSSTSGFFAGGYGPSDEEFYRFTGDELPPGMSGAPVLVSTDGAVVALVKAQRAPDPGAGGLLAPMRGLSSLGRGGELWREHDRFHGSDSTWTSLRDGLEQRSSFAGILSPRAEVELLAILAGLPDDLRVTAEGLPLRAKIRNLAQEQVPAASVHPLLELTWQLSKQAPDSQQVPGTDLATRLRWWTLLTAGVLGQDLQFQRWLQVSATASTRQPAPVRRAERRAVVLGSESFRFAEPNPADQLAASLANPDVGHFEAVDKPTRYQDYDPLRRLPEFIRTGAPSDVLVLYLAGGLDEADRQDDLFMDLAAVPSGQDHTWTLRAHPDTDMVGHRLSLRTLAEVTAHLNDQAYMIILIDYFRLSDATTDVPAVMRRFWPGTARGGPSLVVFGLERNSDGKFADLASLVSAVIRGEERGTPTTQGVSVQELADAVGRARPAGWAAGSVARFDVGPVLAYEPLDDKAIYIRDVLEPARIHGLTGDIRKRYRLTGTDSPEMVAGQMNATIRLWESLVRTREHRTLVRQLLREHEETYHQVLEAAETRQEAELTRLLWRYGGDPDLPTPAVPGADLAERVREVAKLWRLITPGDLAFLGQGRGEEQVRAALRANGVHVEQPPELPVLPPVPGLPGFDLWLHTRGRRHLLDLLPGREPDKAVFDGLLENPAAVSSQEPVPGWTAQAIRDALPDNLPTQARAAAAALRTLDTAGLRSAALYQIATQLRAVPDRRTDDTSVLRRARELGLSDRDARLLGFAITHEPGQNETARKIANWIDANRVCAAHAALTDVAPGPGFTGRELALRVLTERRDLALSTLRRARGEQDADQAWAWLDEAEAIAADLEGIAEARRDLPPLPPPSVEAEIDPDTDAIRVSWQASGSAAGPIRYDVLRHEGVRPGVRDPGRVIEAGMAALKMTDQTAPSNLPLWYSVVAVRGLARSAPAVTEESRTRWPRVTDLSAEPGDGTVALRWRTPPGATRVEVHRADGHSAPHLIADRGSSGLDEGLANGTEYRYQVVALYQPADGQQARSRIKTVRATPRRPLAVLPRVSLRQAPDNDGMLEVLDAPADTDAWVLLATRRSVDLTPGYETGRDRLPGLGEVVSAQARTDLPPLVPAPDSDTVFTAVAVADERARIGDSTVWGPVPDIEGLVAIRRGGQLEVFWHQTRKRKDLFFTVQLASESAGPLDQRTFYPRDYDTDWPLRLAADDGPLRLTVTPWRRLPGEVTCLGRAQLKRVAARPRVSYSIRVVPEGRLRRRVGPAEVTLTLKSKVPVTLDRVEITVRPGEVHPLEYGEQDRDGLSKSLLGLTLRPEVPVTIELGRGHGAYRVRCFTPGMDVELLHPPAAERSIRWPE